MFPNMTGQKVRLVALLNGPFKTFAFAYRLTSPRIAFDNTGFEDVWAQGRGRFSKAPVTVPPGHVRAAGDRGRRRRRRDPRQSAGRGPAQGDRQGADRRRAQPHLGQAEGQVQPVRRPDHRPLRRRPVRRPHPLPDSRASASSTCSPSSRWFPNPSGKGTLVTGKGRAWVRRFDNKFLAGLAGRPSLSRGRPRPGQRLHRPFPQPRPHRARRSGSPAPASGGATAPSSSKARALSRPTARSR